MRIVQFAQYLAEHDRSERTIVAYSADLSVFGQWYQGQFAEPAEAERIMGVDVREYKEHMIEGGYQPATINRRLASVRAYLTWCVALGGIDHNPADDIKGVAQQAAQPRWLDRTDQRAIVRAVQAAYQGAKTEAAQWRTARDRAIVALMLWAGLRREEIARAETSKCAIPGRGVGSLQVIGKGRKARTVPLNTDATRATRAWLKKRGGDQSRYLFLSQKGGGMCGKAVYRVVLKYAGKAGVAITPHILRHTFGKSLADKGIGLDRIATLMGHADVNTTRLYLEPSRADLARAVEAIAWTG